MPAESSPLPPAVVFREGRAGNSPTKGALCVSSSVEVLRTPNHSAGAPQCDGCVLASRLSLTLDEAPPFGAHAQSDPLLPGAHPPRSLRDYLQPRGSAPERETIVVLSSDDPPTQPVAQAARPRAKQRGTHATALLDNRFCMQPDDPPPSQETGPAARPSATATCLDIVAELHRSGVAAASASLGHQSLVAWSSDSVLVPHVSFYVSAQTIHTRHAHSPASVVVEAQDAASSLVPGARLLLVVVGARSHAAGLEAAARRAFRLRLASGGRVSDPGACDAWRDLEDAVWHAALSAGVRVHHIESSAVASHICASTRAVRSALETGETCLGFSPRDAPKAARTPAEAWLRMLVQIPRVTPGAADAVARAFPTPGSLLSASEDALSAIVLDSGRPVGPVLAARILRCLRSSSDDPAF